MFSMKMKTVFLKHNHVITGLKYVLNSSYFRCIYGVLRMLSDGLNSALVEDSQHLLQDGQREYHRVVDKK